MQLSYNGFSFSDIRTVTFEQKPIFTDDGVEYLWDEFTIRVSAIYTNSPNSNSAIGMLFPTTGLAPGNANESPAATYVRLMGCLSQKRQQLIFSDTDSAETIVINSPVLGALTDAKWGPEPEVLSIKKVTPITWEIEWQVKTWLHKCCGNNSPANEIRNTTPFIANRWTEMCTYDDEFYATVTRSGTLYFRADRLLAAGMNLTTRQADYYRGRIVAANPLRPNFMRVSSQYDVSSDGLQIKYTITDKQVYCMPLPPCIKVKSNYKVIGNRAQVLQEEINVTAWGGPLSDGGTDKTQLFAAAHRIAMSRLDEITGTSISNRNLARGLMNVRDGLPGFQNWKIIEHFEVIEDMMENKIDLRMKTFGRQRADQTYFGLNINNAMGLDPSIGNVRVRNVRGGRVFEVAGRANAGAQESPPNPGVYGAVAMQIVSAVTCDPCLGAECRTMPPLTAPNPGVF